MMNLEEITLSILLGTFCEQDYNGCNLAGACQVNWKNDTQCIAFNASEQIRRNQSYICNGSCVRGYYSSNSYTCDGRRIFLNHTHLEIFLSFVDEDECTMNSTICGPNGNCTNTVGRYLCSCPTGYKFDNDIGTCVGALSFFFKFVEYFLCWLQISMNAQIDMLMAILLLRVLWDSLAKIP